MIVLATFDKLIVGKTYKGPEGYFKLGKDKIIQGFLVLRQATRDEWLASELELTGKEASKQDLEKSLLPEVKFYEIHTD